MLKNAAGKVLKANHSFGAAYLGAARVNFSPVMSYRDTTILYWTCRNVAGTIHQLFYEGGAVAATTAMLNGDSNLYTQWAGSSQMYSGALRGRIFHGLRINQTAALAVGNGIAAGQAYSPADIATRANLAYATIAANEGVTDYYAFDRYLTDAEVSHVLNALIGNQPITLGGCIVAAEFEKAELLDCSLAQDGSDIAAAVRNNIAGKPHIKLTGLPAGTAQQQVDYANANLFTAFL